MENLTGVLETVHAAAWGPWTTALFLGAGLILSVRLRFFPVLGFRKWWGETAGSLFAGIRQPQTASAFENACTALAATVGTGNIVGVATALTAGGPGALFWMWISAVIGMATAYAETALGRRYRYRCGERILCGPMVYMEYGLGMPGLGICYALFALLSSLAMGSMVQAGSAGEALRDSLGVPGPAAGLAVAVLAGAVILGGAGRIVRFCARLMPAAAGLYSFFSVLVIVSCAGRLPEIFCLILREAFRPSAAAGGAAGFFSGAAVRYGLSRGVFSNEAGLGSLAVLHGAAEDTTPVQQGMWAIFEVFFDTLVICTLTGLVILCMADERALPGIRLQGAEPGLTGAALAAACFSHRLGVCGGLLVQAALPVFAFATIVAWYYVGLQTAEYLAGKLRGGRILLLFYPAAYLTAAFVGCAVCPEQVWLTADIANALMACPNLAAVVWLALKKDLCQNS